VLARSHREAVCSEWDSPPHDRRRAVKGDDRRSLVGPRSG